MSQTPLLLANDSLLSLVQDTDIPLAVIAMEEEKLAGFKLPAMAEVLNLKQALDGLRNNRFSYLLMSPRRGPLLDLQRPFISRYWSARKKIFQDSFLRQFQIPKVALAHRVPLAVVDLWDTFHIAEWNHPLLLAAEVYWMRELPLHPHLSMINTSRRLRQLSNRSDKPVVQATSKMKPISIGISDSLQKWAKPAAKRYDIFYSGTDSNPMREEVRQALLRLKAEGKYQVYLPEIRLSPEDFFQACAESYLVVSPAGYGWDCYRHYEAGLCASVPVMNYPSIRRYRPFIEGENGLYFDPDDNGLERCLNKALENRPRLIEMGQNAREHVIRYHLYSKLLRHMLQESVEVFR